MIIKANLFIVITIFLLPITSSATKNISEQPKYWGWKYYYDVIGIQIGLPLCYNVHICRSSLGWGPLMIGTELWGVQSIPGKLLQDVLISDSYTDFTKPKEIQRTFNHFWYGLPVSLYLCIPIPSSKFSTTKYNSYFYIFSRFSWNGHLFMSNIREPETIGGDYMEPPANLQEYGLGLHLKYGALIIAFLNTKIIADTFVIFYNVDYALYRESRFNGFYFAFQINLGGFGGESEKIFPPDVIVLTKFSDANSNGILESGESAVLKCELKNKGQGSSGNVVLNLSIPTEFKPYLEVDEVVKTKGLKPGESRAISIPIKAKSNIPTGTYKIYVSGRDRKGNEVQGSYVTIQTKQTEPPYLTFETTPFDDNQDRIFDAGEMVGFKLYIQNLGRGEAFNVNAFVKDKYDNILTEREIGSIKPAEKREVSLQFQMPTVLKTGRMEFKIELSEMSGFAPSAKTIIAETREYAAVVFAPHITINDDRISPSQGDDEGDIDKGETIELIISVRNNGSGTARGVKTEVFSNQKGIDFITAKTVIGDIPSGSSKEATLVFTVKQFFADNNLNLRVEISEMTGQFTKTFPVDYELGKPPIITIVSGQKFPVRKNTYALIIGINSYEDKSIPSLKYAENDARVMESLLKSNGVENVYLLIGKNATQKNINVRLAELERMVDEKSFVYIFFSGHGSSRLFVNDTRFPYYLPYDTDATNATALQTSCISWVDLTASIKRMKSKGIVVAVNACYGVKPAGAAAGVGAPEKPPSTSLGEGRVIISASAANQMAYEVKNYNHSIFFYRLIEALRGEGDFNNDGWVDVSETFKWVSEKVEEDAKKIKRTLQTPTISPETGSKVKVTRCR